MIVLSITIALVFNIIPTPKITCSYWFIIIFFFLPKKTPNILDYSDFDCLIFFFQSKNISYIFNCVAVFYFFSPEKFLTCLIMLSSHFLSSESKRAFSASKILLRFLSWAFCCVNYLPFLS